jgi:S1-C subfamily serine protease
MKLPAILGVLALAATACAQPPAPPFMADEDAVVPGTIGVVVRSERSAVVVADVGEGSSGARSGVRVGDVVLRFNGKPVTAPRHFYRLVVDSRPGSAARLDLLRDGARLAIEVPVQELDTMPRG